MYPWLGGVFVFLVLGSILALAIIYGGTKLMTYLENRKTERQERRGDNSEAQ